MTDKTFTYAGVSTCDKGNTKVRFTNDLATRIKILTKGGHNDVDLRELPRAMTKPEACSFLMDQEGFEGIQRMAVEDGNADYNVVRVTKAKGKAANAVSTPTATKTPAKKKAASKKTVAKKSAPKAKATAKA